MAGRDVMNFLRQDTDYALRAMVVLAGGADGRAVCARELARRAAVSYQFACKILQKLRGAGLVASSMGPKGGFYLSRAPRQINLLQVIQAAQGRLSLNRCLFDSRVCPRRRGCPISKKLAELQRHVEDFLAAITLAELAGPVRRPGKSKSKNQKAKMVTGYGK